MTTATLTPFDRRDATRLGRRRYRKQILPIDSIRYRGRKIKFDKDFLTDLAQSFKDEAYPQVPFVLADGGNQHNMDPERFRGEIVDLELTDDGLDAVIEVDRDGEKLLKRNPRLGVSARIVEGVAKADGRTFPRAIQHVLGTMNPRLTNLRPWEAVDLSEDAEVEVTDLTDQHYEEEGMAKAKTKGGSGDKTGIAKVVLHDGREIDLSKISDEEFQELLLADDDVDDPEDDVDEDVEDDDGTDDGDDGDDGDDDDDDDDDSDVVKAAKEVLRREETRRAKTKGKTKSAKTKTKTSTKTREPVGADLSDVEDTETRTTVRQMQIDLAEERFEREKDAWQAAGVPPFLIDLAEPLLTQPQAVVIDLAEGEDPLNATEIAREMLDGFKGLIDLTPDLGHGIDLSTEPDDEDKVLLDQWDKEYGKA